MRRIRTDAFWICLIVFVIAFMLGFITSRFMPRVPESRQFTEAELEELIELTKDANEIMQDWMRIRKELVKWNRKAILKVEKKEEK